MTETTDRAALRELIAEAARTVPLRLGPNALGMAERGEPIRLSGGEAWAVAEVVLGVLPAPADRAAVLREAADAAAEQHRRNPWTTAADVIADLRRMAAEPPAAVEPGKEA